MRDTVVNSGASSTSLEQYRTACGLFGLQYPDAGGLKLPLLKVAPACTILQCQCVVALVLCIIDSVKHMHTLTLCKPVTWDAVTVRAALLLVAYECVCGCHTQAGDSNPCELATLSCSLALSVPCWHTEPQAFQAPAAWPTALHSGCQVVRQGETAVEQCRWLVTTAWQHAAQSGCTTAKQSHADSSDPQTHPATSAGRTVTLCAV